MGWIEALAIIATPGSGFREDKRKKSGGSAGSGGGRKMKFPSELSVELEKEEDEDEEPNALNGWGDGLPDPEDNGW